MAIRPNVFTTYLQRFHPTPLNCTIVETSLTTETPEGCSFSQKIDFYRTHSQFLPKTTPPSSIEQQIEDFVQKHNIQLDAKLFAHALNIWDFLKTCDEIQERIPQTFYHKHHTFNPITVIKGNEGKNRLYIHLYDRRTIEISPNTVAFTDRVFKSVSLPKSEVRINSWGSFCTTS